MKIWAKTEEFREGKFLVVRRDGTVPHWPLFVLGARDPAATEALQTYAERMGYEPEYVASIRELADDFTRYREQHGLGDPEAPPHREDNGDVISAMRGNVSLILVVPDKENVLKPASGS